MPLPSLADLKAFARVDHDDEDATLSTLLAAATDYVEAATGRDYSTDAPDRAHVAIVALATHWYQNRELTGEAYVVPFHVRSLCHQLRDWKDPEVAEAEVDPIL